MQLPSTSDLNTSGSKITEQQDTHIEDNQHPPNNDRQNSDRQNNDTPNSDRQDSDTLASLLTVYVKGMAMGMADIVPGVSGGTIALISGVYQRLITAISRVDLQIVSIWRQQGLVNGFVAVWKHVDATFLLCLLAGIATSFVTLAGIIRDLLENQPLQIWSLFFGLVIATVFVLLKEITQWNWQRVLLFIMGIVLAVAISQAPMMTGTPSLPYLFFAGAIAICAMILPGVSGSFILLLLGAYQAVLTAVHDKNIVTLATVMAGMVTGLLVFSKFLKWLLNTRYHATLTVLTGFIAGSLVKIYPWKITQVVDNQDANTVTQAINVLPWHYPTGAHWVSTMSLMLLGAVLVFVISWWGSKHNTHSSSSNK